MKYYYEGLALKEYCKQNYVLYGTIIGRIIKLKEKEPNLSNEELVEKALEQAIRNKEEYYYEEMPLKDYCKKNGISYNTIAKRINRLRKKEANLTNKELVEKAIEQENLIKYYYNGMTLRNYCKENDVSYNTIESRINKLKQKETNLTNEELVEKALEKENIAKYYYKGISLTNYCKENGISYETIISRINKLKEKEPNLINKGLVEKALEKAIRNKEKYYYKGMPLKEYCKENGISYETIISRINKLKQKEPNLTYNELVEKALGQENQIKYYYKGIPLTDYCKENGISYNVILKRINKLRKKESSLTNEELVKISINVYKQNKKECSSNYMKDTLNKLDEESTLPVKHKYVDQCDNYFVSDTLGQDIKYVDDSKENLNTLNNEKIKRLNNKN